MKLTAEERALVNDRVKVVTDRIHAGDAFFAELAAQIAAFKPDLVWLNPLQAFIDGDIKDSRDLGNFLRRGLNRLNEPASFGFIGVHHTNKPPTGKDKTERTWSEGMYDMAGGAELINWARFIINLRPGPELGQFNLVLSKRGSDAGVTKRVEQGAGYVEKIVTTIHLKWSEDLIDIPGRKKRIRCIFWEPRTPAADEMATESKRGAGGRPRSHTFETYAAAFSVGIEKAMGIRVAHRAAQEIRPIGMSAFYTLVEEAIDVGQLVKENSDPRRPKIYRPASRPGE